MAVNWLGLLHPFGGFGVFCVVSVAAYFGWQYRTVRLGKRGGADGVKPKDIVHLQQEHQKAGYWVVAMAVTVWLGGHTMTEWLHLDKLLENSYHETTALLFVVLVLASAGVILLFRRQPWARPVHLTLNGGIVALLALQILSGLGLTAGLFK